MSLKSFVVILFILPSLAFPKVGCFDALNALFSTIDRETTRERAVNALSRDISEIELDAIQKAHKVGRGELGKDKITEAMIFNYTIQQLKRKADILNKAGFSKEERKLLMKKGVVGDELVPLKNGAEMRPDVAYSTHKAIIMAYMKHRKLMEELITKVRENKTSSLDREHFKPLVEMGFIDEFGYLDENVHNIIECSVVGDLNNLQFPAPFREKNFRLPLNMLMKDTEGVSDAIILSEGTPQVFGFLKRLARTQSDWTLLFLNLEKMNIRGKQIQVIYEDYAKGDFNTFIAGIRNRDPKMVEIVNQAMGKDFPHQAKP
jgi:hypothetical protein